MVDQPTPRHSITKTVEGILWEVILHYYPTDSQAMSRRVLVFAETAECAIRLARDYDRGLEDFRVERRDLVPEYRDEVCSVKAIGDYVQIAKEGITQHGT